MSKPKHNLRVFLFVLFYMIMNLLLLVVGPLLADVPFAFGLLQLTIFTFLVTFKYDLIMEEVKKLKKHIRMNLLLFLVCCVLFSIVAMIAYLGVLGTSIMVTILPSLPLAMLTFQIATALFAFGMNEVFFIQLMKSLNYKQSEQNKLMLGLVAYVFLRNILFYFMNPAGIVVGMAFSLVTGFCGVMLIYKNKSLLLYPLAIMAMGTLFVLM